MGKFALAVILIIVSTSTLSQAATSEEIARWNQHAANVTIIRDDWGIAHIYAKTDADAVFGAEYAQAEDDFNRIETNYLNAMGRLSEAEGESKIYQDLRMKLFINPSDLKKDYEASPAWLKKLMDGFADGLNFYLYQHPKVTPRVITHFEPWMALSFTEGSIGGDIERIQLSDLEAFYGASGHAATSSKSAWPATAELHPDEEPRGSNGAAFAPSNTASHHAMLLINPHTSFYFRSELQMVSDEGLNAYGASTWGQFFIYQGFNARTGWMHTSSGVDAVDEYLETITKKADQYFYKYGDKELPVEASTITVPYKTGSGMAEKQFTVYRTNHGPVVRETGGRWVSVKLMQKPIEQLEQSFLRTKTSDYKSFLKTIELYANSSNNTIFADADGDIAYFHGNFIPRRDPKFDFTKPVEGSDPAADWHGNLSLNETPHLLNPKTGWLYNSNDAPWSAAGRGTFNKQDFPAYVEQGGESARTLHALKVFPEHKNFSIDSVIGAAYDSYLPWFARTIPVLIKAWDSAADSDTLKLELHDPIAALRPWDFRWAADSVPTTLAVYWGTEIERRTRSEARQSGMTSYDYVASRVAPGEMLEAFATACDKLTSDAGTWNTRWGTMNRFQRLDDDITPHFDDSAPSIPVAFTSSLWGSLASFGARQSDQTKKWYGNSGNSFVAVVEFGPRVRARAVTAGGESGHPGSRHFNDEATRYATGNLREVYFYRAQLKGHTESEYHPGSETANSVVSGQ